MLRILSVLTHVFVFPFGGLQDFLIFTLPIVGEPALDLSDLQARFQRKNSLVFRLEVRMIDIIEEPLLKQARLVRFKRFHPLQTIVLHILNVLHGTLRPRGCARLVLVQHLLQLIRLLLLVRDAASLHLGKKLVVRGPVALETVQSELLGKFGPRLLAVVRMLPRLVVGYEGLVGRRRCHVQLSLVESLLNLDVGLHLVVQPHRRLHVCEVSVWHRANLLGLHLINLLLATDVGERHELRLRLYEPVPADTYLRGQLLRKLLVVLGAGYVGGWPALLVHLILKVLLLLVLLVVHLLSVKNIIIEAAWATLD